MRMLLVEDDEMIGEPIVDTMRRAGYAIDWARDGREAELSLDHDVYDVVLLDLGLPKSDGVEVLNRYRRRGGSAPVIILTARDAVEEYPPENPRSSECRRFRGNFSTAGESGCRRHRYVAMPSR